jgi:hypothetical protein
MLTERLTFQAKYGHGDELVALFKEWYQKMAASSGMVGGRIYTDATGPMFTVILESDFPDWDALAKFNAADSEMFSDPFFQEWFGRMTQVTEKGERQLFNSEKMM